MNKNEALEFVNRLEIDNRGLFNLLEGIALKNQEKVLNAFREYKISTRHFSGTTGYGYDDVGRDTLRKVYAKVFGAEDALVSPNITCGTHAISIALLGLLAPNDTLLSITGKPYDTLGAVIKGTDSFSCSLKDYSVKYNQIELVNNDFDYDLIKKQINLVKPKVVFIQRSRGYSDRSPISIERIEKIVKFVKDIKQDIIVFVDNCYGEFVEEKEPTAVNADVICGSLIKNPGGGIVPTGGYIAGTQQAIDQITNRFTTPSLKAEVGSYEMGYRLFYQGLFLAPHVTLQALKGSVIISSAFAKLGYATIPKNGDMPHDIITSIVFKNKQQVIDFCGIVQENSPIDSFVKPVPWEMPGYADEVIMAAGAFVSGSSIELSCDGPMREPFIAYIQGGITYEHIKLALINCLVKIN